MIADSNNGMQEPSNILNASSNYTRYTDDGTEFFNNFSLTLTPIKKQAEFNYEHNLKFREELKNNGVAARDNSLVNFELLE